MITKHQTDITKDLANKKLLIVREFDAPIQQVWQAWTDRHLLDQWWAPKPWKAITKTMDFREGGHWLYAMEGPDGSRQWCRLDYKTINPEKGFTAVDAFCDENGNVTTEFPGMHWTNNFIQTPGGTRVEVEINFNSESDLEKIIEMGFKEGFTAALSNLDELFQPATTSVPE